MLNFYFLCMFLFFSGVITGFILMRQTSNCFFLIICCDAIYSFLWVRRLRKRANARNFSFIVFSWWKIDHYQLVWFLKISASWLAESMSINPKQCKIFLSAERRNYYKKLKLKNDWQVPWKTVTKKQNGGQVFWEQHLNSKFKGWCQKHKHAKYKQLDNGFDQSDSCRWSVLRQNKNKLSAVCLKYFCIYYEQVITWFFLCNLE